jgi:hypothetical protein
MSDMFCVKNGLKTRDVLSLWLVSIALEYAIRKNQGNEEGLKINGKHYFLVYDDDVSTLDGTIHTIQRNKEALIFSGKGISLEVKAEKAKYMIMSQ